MAVRHEIANQLLEGSSPIDIADDRGRRVKDIVNLVLLQVGEGDLRLSDVLFSIPVERQRQYEDVLEALPARGMYSWEQSCRSRRLDFGEFKLYLLSKDSQHGDMYIYLRELEVSIHTMVRHTLETTFHHHDDAWWREGVPLQIRQRCATTKEADPEPISDLFAYTNFIDLKKIIDTHWATFKTVVPSPFENQKKALLKRFDKLNNIRNGVMHPIKPIEITPYEFGFIRDTRTELHPSEWRLDSLSAN